MPESAPRGVVIFDLDDTLFDLRTPMAVMLNRMTGTTQRWQDWASYDVTRQYGVTVDAFFKQLIEDEVLQQAEPEPGAADIVGAVARLGYDIRVWTARAFHPDGHAISRHQVNRLGLSADALRLFSPSEDKAEALASVDGRVAGFFDDNVQHVTRAIAAGCPAALIDRPWNRQAHLPRLTHLRDTVAMMCDRAALDGSSDPNEAHMLNIAPR